MSLISDFDNQSIYPNLIGKLGNDCQYVIIKIFDESHEIIKIPYCYCQQIGNTGRWSWSTRYLPNNIFGKINYEMLSNLGNRFLGSFFIPLKGEKHVS